MSSLFDLLADQIRSLWDELRKEGSEHGYLPLLRPVSPYDQPALLSPLATLGVALALLVTSGVAVAALGALILSLLVLWFLLTEVLGISIEVKPFRL